MKSITELHNEKIPIMALFFQGMIYGGFPNPERGNNEPITYHTNLRIARLTTNKHGDYQVRVEDVSPIESELIRTPSGPYRPTEQIFASALDIYNHINELLLPVLVLSKERNIAKGRYQMSARFEDGPRFGYFAALPLEQITELERPQYHHRPIETYANEHPSP